MKPKGYVLFVTLSNAKSLKSVLKCLKEVNVLGATVMDSVGSASIFSIDDIYIPMIASSIQNLEDIKNYGKTLFSIVKDEETVIKAMDAIENRLNIDVKNLGKGIMFSIPIYSSSGVIIK